MSTDCAILQASSSKILRVVIIGAESTGKTTLACRLAEHYGTVWAPEYLRDFVLSKGAPPEKDDAWQVASGHLAQERALSDQAQRVLFLDTDLVLTCIYQRHYFGSCPTKLIDASAASEGDLYLVTDMDIPWVPDPGQRDGPLVRSAVHECLMKELHVRGITYELLSGSIKERMRTAVRLIDLVLGQAD